MWQGTACVPKDLSNFVLLCLAFLCCGLLIRLLTSIWKLRTNRVYSDRLIVLDTGTYSAGRIRVISCTGALLSDLPNHLYSTIGYELTVWRGMCQWTCEYS